MRISASRIRCRMSKLISLFVRSADLDVVDEADEIELERPVAEIGELDGRRGNRQHESCAFAAAIRSRAPSSTSLS